MSRLSLIVPPALALLIPLAASASTPAGNPAARHRQPVLPPRDSAGFTPSPPSAPPGQALVPPPQSGRGGVITPPSGVDRAIARPTPPAAAYPTPVLTPPRLEEGR